MKHPVRSKMLWFNGIATVGAAAESAFHLLQPVLGAKTYPVLLFAITLGNVALRFVTTEALSLRAPPKGGSDAG